jgi:predicted nucleotidyltransferase
LRQRLPDGLLQVLLFGSQARGDATEASDYDFAVIVATADSKTVTAVRETEVEFLDRFDTLSSALVYGEKDWERRKGMPIGRNILREGVPL